MSELLRIISLFVPLLIIPLLHVRVWPVFQKCLSLLSFALIVYVIGDHDFCSFAVHYKVARLCDACSLFQFI